MSHYPTRLESYDLCHHDSVALYVNQIFYCRCMSHSLVAQIFYCKCMSHSLIALSSIQVHACWVRALHMRPTINNDLHQVYSKTLTLRDIDSRLHERQKDCPNIWFGLVSNLTKITYYLMIAKKDTKQCICLWPDHFNILITLA